MSQNNKEHEGENKEGKDFLSNEYVTTRDTESKLNTEQVNTVGQRIRAMTG